MPTSRPLEVHLVKSRAKTSAKNGDATPEGLSTDKPRKHRIFFTGSYKPLDAMGIFQHFQTHPDGLK